MAKASPVSVFLAASSLLLASASTGVVAQAQSSGGLQEWSTDQAVDEAVSYTHLTLPTKA